jgi:hypothetical protein
MNLSLERSRDKSRIKPAFVIGQQKHASGPRHPGYAKGTPAKNHQNYDPAA